MKVAVSLFPDDLVLRPKLDVLARGNMISQQHVPASDINLRHIAARLPNIAVHVRDPRQATVSWMHHLKNFNVHRKTIPACEYGLQATSSALPESYFNWNDEKQMDWLLNFHFEQLISWTQGWVKAADEASVAPAILFTSHEELANDRDDLLRRLLRHYGIDPKEFNWNALPEATPQTHFRKGRIDEWRETLTETQMKKATARIPDELALRFGWDL